MIPLWACRSGRCLFVLLRPSRTRTPGVTTCPPLGLPENATTVRVEGGRTLTTDGPFVEMMEAVGGVFVLEAADLDAAIEVASRVPAARLGGAIEIRPVETYW